jgi:hypothetical protein
MPDLVTLAELKTYLGDAPASTDDVVLTELLDHVEALFESETLRAPGSYTAAATARTEVLDATGTSRLYVAYPISALTSIKLGYDAAAPTETLAVANKAVVVYGVGARVITRTDGGKFGTVGQSRYVQVVYDHLGNLPEDAKIAIKRACALIYRQRGSEDVASESAGSFYSRDMARFGRDFVGDDPIWRMAVVANTPVVIA